MSTFPEWLDSARSQNLDSASSQNTAALLELEREAGPSLLNGDAAIRETAWNEVIAPMKERIASLQITIYTGSDTVGLEAELEKQSKRRASAPRAPTPLLPPSRAHGWIPSA